MNGADGPAAKRRFRRPAARKRPATGPAFRNDSQTKTSDVNPDATKAIELLRRLVALPSPSGREEATAELLRDCLAQRGAAPERLHNNVWARSAHFDPARPTLLLNSHHDTVRPAAGYTRDPYDPAVEGDRLYGLGSNDAGASLVALTETFLALYRRPLPFNLVLALTAEEECSGPRGIGALLPELGRIDMALVGEPTGMRAAVGERGLVVLDCTARGRSGHAARNEGVNALYAALDDIARLRGFRFERESEVLGPIGIAVTQIAAGTQHNVVPDECRFVVDVRTTDAYTNEQTVAILRAALRSEIAPRSTRLSGRTTRSSARRGPQDAGHSSPRPSPTGRSCPFRRSRWGRATRPVRTRPTNTCGSPRSRRASPVT